MEYWLPVRGYEGRYAVSDCGQIRTFIAPRKNSNGLLAAAVDRNIGYRRVILYKGDGSRQSFLLHRIICETFNGIGEPGQIVRHLNGDPLDNRSENLAWGTQIDNILDSVNHGTHPMTAKTHCKHGHEFTAENTYLYKGGRSCRICRADAVRKWEERQ